MTPLIGAWTIVAPWLVSGPTPDNTTITSNVIAGILCLVFSLGTMSVSMRRTTPRHS